VVTFLIKGLWILYPVDRIVILDSLNIREFYRTEHTSLLFLGVSSCSLGPSLYVSIWGYFCFGPCVSLNVVYELTFGPLPP
jgi:hypothetical protein